MLRPCKHPLIDEPLVATGSVTRRRSQWTQRFVLLAVLLLGTTWIWTVHNQDDEIYAESWLRATVATLVNRQFQDSISLAKDSRLSDQVKALQTERAEMQIRLQTLDKLVQSSKIDSWLRQLSALRETDNEISYEILVANPHSTNTKTDAQSGNQANNSITVTVRGIDKFDTSAPENGLAQSVLRFKTVTHELIAPPVAETIKGKVGSKVAKFLIATVTPFNNPAMTEVRIIPVRDRSRSP